MNFIKMGIQIYTGIMLSHFYTPSDGLLVAGALGTLRNLSSQSVFS